VRRRDARTALAPIIEITTDLSLEPWQHTVCDRLERLKHETGQRILIHGPPQFGKSIIISQRFPAWIIGNDPTHRCRIACYNETHATRFSGVNLQVMRSPEYRNVFPSVTLPNVASEKDWSTVERDAIADGQPTMRALGLGSGFTGLGADTLVIDDPYKSREEAFSLTINERVWNWWCETVTPRLNPASNVVVMFHRWKQDDLAGRLLEQKGWELLRFPAIADGLEGDSSGLEPGTPLSARYPIEYLEGIRSGEDGIGSAAFESLYQGRPQPRGGLLFKAEWLTRDNLYAALPTEAKRRVRYWDIASGETGTAAFTAGVLVTKHKGLYYVEDVIRGQWSLAERKAQMRVVAERDRAKYGMENEPTIYFERPIGQGGREMSQDISAALDGFTIRPDSAVVDKVTRAEPSAAQYEAGNVRWIKGDWNAAFRDELLAFPQGKLKDQVDAQSGAFAKLARKSIDEYDLSGSI
jgi:predicted phage terminase large subunit-like protein